MTTTVLVGNLLVIVCIGLLCAAACEAFAALTIGGTKFERNATRLFWAGVVTGLVAGAFLVNTP